MRRSESSLPAYEPRLGSHDVSCPVPQTNSAWQVSFSRSTCVRERALPVLWFMGMGLTPRLVIGCVQWSHGSRKIQLGGSSSWCCCTMTARYCVLVSGMGASMRYH